MGVIAENCANLKEVVFNNITSKNKVKIAAEDVGVFLPGCPNAELGHMDESVVSALNSSYTTKYVDYAIITPTVNKKVGLVESFRCEQRNSTKLLWRSVPNIGYYQVYYYKNGKWDFPLTEHPAETEDQILQRAKMAIAKLSELYPDDNIIVVTHGQFARNMFAANSNCSYKEIESFANAEVRLLQR